MVDTEIKKGNGDKIVLISEDDELNGFHTLWTGFESGTSVAKTLRWSPAHDCQSADKVVLLY